MGAPDVALVGGHVGHRRGRLGRQRPDRAGVQVDARGQGRDGLPDRPQLLGIGQGRDDHGRMIPAMSGLARPEILATTEWLAENIGQLAIRVLDLRWRPDGSAPAVHASGHIPGAALVDWRADLVDDGEGGETILLASPARIASLAVRTGITDDTTVVVYDDTRACSRPGRGGRCGPTASNRSGCSTAGTSAGRSEGREVSKAAVEPGTAGFTVRGPNRTRLTTSDVRGLLGSPDVTLLDARAPAEYRGFEGNTKRLGHIPGAVNVPVGATSQPGRQRLRDGAELRDLLHRANVTRGRRMVCYDGSGIAAAKLAFVLTLLGHEDVAVYDGGWAEWGNRLDLPVDR